LVVRLGDAFVVLDRDLQVVYASPAFQRRPHPLSQPLEGVRIDRLLPDLQGNRVVARLREALDSGEGTIEGPLTLGGVDAPCWYLEAHPIAGYLCVMLRPSRGDPDAVVNRLPEGVLWLDGKGVSVSVNTRLCELTGLPSETLLALNPPLPTATQEESRRLTELLRCLLAGEWPRGASAEIRLKGRGGSELVAELMTRRLDPEGWLMTVRDVGASLEPRRQRERTAVSMRLGALAARLGHEFNNALTPIQGRADLATATEELSEESRRHLRQLSMAVDKAAVIARGLLDLSPERWTQHETVDLRELLHEVILHQPLARPGGAEISLELPRGSCRIRADRAALTDMLEALVEGVCDLRSDAARLSLELEQVSVEARALLFESRARPGRYQKLGLRDDTGLLVEALTEHLAWDPDTVGIASGRIDLWLSRVFVVTHAHGGFVRVAETNETALSVYLPSTRRD
jgi:PAS domain S-box-containing protein